MISEYIKKETTKLHSQLEQNRLLVCLTSNGLISIDDYLLILKKFYGLIYPLEKSIEHKLLDDNASDFKYKSRYPYLITDINYLNYSVESISICKVLPEIDSLEALVGVLYLLEGAKHGAKIIAQSLRKFNPQLPANYFSAALNDKSISWILFRERIDQINTLDKKEVLNTVKSIYSGFIQWFREDKDCEKQNE